MLTKLKVFTARDSMYLIEMQVWSQINCQVHYETRVSVSDQVGDRACGLMLTFRSLLLDALSRSN